MYHLCIDIGNSDMVFGLHNDQKKWAHVFRIPTHLAENSAEYEAKMRFYFLENDILPQQIKKVAISSVVPLKTAIVKDICGHFLNLNCFTTNPTVFSKLQFSTLRPHQIGSDLVCNAMYGFKKYPGKNVLIFDFGTALTCTILGKNAQILGVTIAPGLQTAVKSLFSNTAQLPEVPLVLPKSIIGQDTVHAIQAGILWGYVGNVKEQISQITNEIGEKPVVLATGGLSSILTPLQDMFDYCNVCITLEGLLYIANEQNNSI